MSRAAEILKTRGADIFQNWEVSVKKEIPASQISSNLALRNQLPNLLDRISDIILRYEGETRISEHEKFEEVIKDSLDHGRHRATTSHYTVKQILSEYVVFHRVVTEMLIDNKAYSKEVGIILKYTIETAMLHSAGSFTESLQEMREKLVGTLAHDIRTPISAAYFALDMMPKIDCEKKNEDLRKMGLKSLKKSLELLEGLLDAISIQAGEGITLDFSEINIVKEIKWVHTEASQIFSNEILFECDRKKITGVFDGTAVRRVVENLVTNAVKYGAAKSPVTLMVKDAGEEVVIGVHNFGKPIHEAHQSQIFHFLNRGHKKHLKGLESWGMGLTLVKSVARGHGGRITLESNEETGTTFSLILNKKSNAPGKFRTELNFPEN